MGRPKQFDPDVAVEQAMATFWRKGYASTTPQDLVAALGIGKGSLYNTFESKHALFERALRRYRDTAAAELVEMLGRPGPVKERLRAAMEAIVEFDLADPDRKGCFAVNTAAELAGVDPEATGLVARMFARTESALLAVIEEGQRSGELDPGRDAEAIASMLLAVVIGMRVLAKTADGPAQLRRTVDAALDAC
ncbi:TetR/AcrR family transcriptional regulator [Solihabitans fulvus]|uniref:TetR/AcrR family transcriptional regulator n=1 Tax=Solihabitans fulvus TaxID=1892852 RepID=A0A5B2X742_9PSEU|nr:TetR/AcrR family transcriptional regulator [Solihabitans fulvus]KAA2258712.1 TetR/AcrR family transcriptional regulator [Solihabitans fulvus]